MRQRRIVLHPYLEQELLERIHAAVGADLPFDEQENKDVVDEDVVNEEVDELDSDENESQMPMVHK